MKIAVPASGPSGLESVVHGHVATAPVFVIVDMESGEVTAVPNPGLKEGDGSLSPLGVVRSLKVDALICAGIGRWAIRLIEAAGTKVYIAHGGLVADAIEDFKAGRLRRAGK